MNDTERHFLKRQAIANAELAQAHIPWVLDGMEPQNRRSIEARRQTLAAGRAMGISYADLAGFFRLDRSSIFRALMDEPAEVATASPESLKTALIEPHRKTAAIARNIGGQARRLRKSHA